MYIIIGVIVWLILIIFILRFFAVSKSSEEEGIMTDQEEHMLDRSVNCYFCNALSYESDCISADDYNNNDGGSICPRCIEEKENIKH